MEQILGLAQNRLQNSGIGSRYASQQEGIIIHSLYFVLANPLLGLSLLLGVLKGSPAWNVA